MKLVWRRMTDDDRTFRDWMCDGVRQPNRPPAWCGNRAVLILEDLGDGRVVKQHACATCQPEIAVVSEVLES